MKLVLKIFVISFFLLNITFANDCFMGKNQEKISYIADKVYGKIEISIKNGNQYELIDYKNVVTKLWKKEKDCIKYLIYGRLIDIISNTISENEEKLALEKKKYEESPVVFQDDEIIENPKYTIKIENYLSSLDLIKLNLIKYDPSTFKGNEKVYNKDGNSFFVTKQNEKFDGGYLVITNLLFASPSPVWTWLEIYNNSDERIRYFGGVDNYTMSNKGNLFIKNKYYDSKSDNFYLKSRIYNFEKNSFIKLPIIPCINYGVRGKDGKLLTFAKAESNSITEKVESCIRDENGKIIKKFISQYDQFFSAVTGLEPILDNIKFERPYLITTNSGAYYHDDKIVKLIILNFLGKGKYKELSPFKKFNDLKVWINGLEFHPEISLETRIMPKNKLKYRFFAKKLEYTSWKYEELP